MSATRPKKRTRKPTEPTWWWVEGLRKLSGVKVWFPLYCSRTEAGADQIRRMVEGEARRTREGLAGTKDAATLKGYREFRVVPDSEQGIRCSECTSNYLKRVRRGNDRLWKCLNCGHTWPRTPTESFTKEVNGQVLVPEIVSEAPRKKIRKKKPTIKPAQKRRRIT